MIYDSKAGAWTNQESGEILKLNCGQDIDDIGFLIAQVVFKPWMAQTIYAEMCKIVRNSK